MVESEKTIPEGPIRLFLDDERKVPDGWVVARTPREFMDIVDERQKDITALSFDEYLSQDGHLRGSLVAGDLWAKVHYGMVEMPNLGQVGFHSSDDVVARRAAAQLREVMAETPSFPKVDIVIGVPPLERSAKQPQAKKPNRSAATAAFAAARAMGR